MRNKSVFAAAIIIMLWGVSGCSIFAPKAKTPIPTAELQASGQYCTKGGSYKVAFEAAEKFCNRWRAAPSVIRKKITYDGQLFEDSSSEKGVKASAVRTVGNCLPVVGAKDLYETTLTYKCY